MTDITHSNIGSGTIPYTTSIRRGQTLGDGQPAAGYRRGINVVVINPEEIEGTPFFKPSGIVLAANQIFEVSTSGALPYRRSIFIYNNGAAPLLVYNDINVIDEFAFPIFPGGGKTFPVYDNVQLFIKASGAVCDVRFYEH